MANLSITSRSDLARTIILGNGGSGKSWLAGRLASIMGAAITDLDEIHWLPGGYDARRERGDAISTVREIAHGEHWIIEGVYGWLAEQALRRATAVIFLDIPESECVSNVRARGLRRDASQEAFDALIKWIGEYRIRQNANSFGAHQRLFEEFEGPKLRLTSRGEIAAALSEVEARPA